MDLNGELLSAADGGNDGGVDSIRFFKVMCMPLLWSRGNLISSTPAAVPAS